MPKKRKAPLMEIVSIGRNHYVNGPYGNEGRFNSLKDARAYAARQRILYKNLGLR